MNEECTEEWRPVVGFDYYEVNSAGKIRSITRPCGNGFRSGRILKQIPNFKGYLCAYLVDSKVQKTKIVSRLVAMAFLTNPLGLPQVNHKNGIKTDNSVENLEWCTASENVRHAVSTGLLVHPRGHKNPNAAFTEIEILGIRAILAEGRSISKMARQLKVDKTTIHRIKRRISYTNV